MNLSQKLRMAAARCFARLREQKHRRTRRAGFTIGYRATHRRLLVNVSRLSAGATALQLGCVFVPVSRAFAEDLPGLMLATNLALASDCHLVISCSKKARTSEFPRNLAAELGDRLVLINHAEVHPDWHPSLESFSQRAGKFHRANDAGDKRNLVLSLAVCLGWQSVLFLDDDIFSLAGVPTLDAAGLDQALTTLARRSELRVVGWSATNFPDNSVIGHARRLAGMKQESFIGAGAMLVRCDEKISYFPNIYNQDWLFVIAQALLSTAPFRAIGWAGSVGQTAYHPFRNSRAKSEETGDVIGEGLLNLFEDRGTRFAQSATAEYWNNSLQARRELIARLRYRIGRQPLNESSWSSESISGALAAAAKINVQINAEELASYVRVWRADEGWWHYHLESLKKLFGERPEPRSVLESVRAGRPPSPSPQTPQLPSMRLEKRLAGQCRGPASPSDTPTAGSAAKQAFPVA